MRALPDGLKVGALTGALADGWGFDAESADYAPVGGGSYHWVVRDLAGTRRFVTVDDLDQKPWLGDTREQVFDGLRRAFATAVALREAGLGFVVAPILTSDGETVLGFGSRYTIALFPFVDGHAGRFGHYEGPAERTAVVRMLVELHRATRAVAPLSRNVGLDVPGRRHLESALGELDRPWSGGPFSEPARQVVADHASDVADLLALADRLAADVASRGVDPVITHGEPHAANVIRDGERIALIDWDTVALALPERDLWMVAGDIEEEAVIYADAAGHRIDHVAMSFFRLSWDLDDISAFINELRSPHHENEDTEHALEGLTKCVTSRDRWNALLG